MSMFRLLVAASLFSLTPLAAAGQGQTPPAAGPAAEVARPLPDVNDLLQKVVQHQKNSEAIEKQYMWHTILRQDKADGKGGIKSSEIKEYEVFYLNGVRVARQIKQDGKELSPDAQKKENERVDKLAAKARERQDKENAKGEDTDGSGNKEIPLSRFLELGKFSNARRVSVNGRDTIALDFTGDPKAKTHSAGEGVIHELSGTVWVDEKDTCIEHLEGHFVNPFKMAGGLVANIAAGTKFHASNVRVNDEVWLPQSADAEGHARIMLFVVFDGGFHLRMSDYHKFKAGSKLLPNFKQVEGSGEEATPAPPK